MTGIIMLIVFVDKRDHTQYGFGNFGTVESLGGNACQGPLFISKTKLCYTESVICQQIQINISYM